MNKMALKTRKWPLIFISASGFLLLVWACIELILSYSQIDVAASCRFEDQRQSETSGIRLIGQMDGAFWLQNVAEGRLSLMKPSSTGFAFADLNEIRSYKYICEKPDYHCAPIAEAGEKTAWSIKAMLERQVLMQKKSRPDVLFPFLLSDQGKKTLRSSPLKYCGQNFEAGQFSFYQVSGRIVAFESASGRLAIWNQPAYSGGSDRDVAREPDEMWRVDEGRGLIADSCHSDSRRHAARAVVAGQRLILLYDSPQGTQLKAFHVAPSLSPDFSWKSDSRVPHRIWSLTNSSLLSQTVGEPELRRMRLTPESGSVEVTALSATPLFSSEPVVRAGFGNKVALFRSRLGISRWSLVSEESAWDFPSSYRLSAPTRIEIVDQSPARGLLAEQVDDQLRLRAFVCDGK